MDSNTYNIQYSNADRGTNKNLGTDWTLNRTFCVAFFRVVAVPVVLVFMIPGLLAVGF
jgi:hypothetical protein